MQVPFESSPHGGYRRGLARGNAAAARRRLAVEPLEDRHLLSGESVIITEFMASNQSGLVDGFGNTSDWLEVWNPTERSIELGGFFLTDDAERLDKWPFPTGMPLAPGEFLVVYASGQDTMDSDGIAHTNFKLDAGGEYLALVDPSLNVVSQFGTATLEYPAQQTDVSYGLITHPDLQDDPRYFQEATPGAPNIEGYVGIVADTKFSADRGFYDGRITVEITSATAGATIAYTLDGSVPSATNGFLATARDDQTPPVAVIEISTTATVRAVAFKDEWQPTNVDTQTYLFLADVVRQTGVGLPDTWGHAGADYDMDPDIVADPAYSETIIDDLRAIPSLSLVTELKNWFDTRVGIYPRGQGSERPVSAELILPDGSSGFQIDAAVEIQGGTSTDRWKSDKLSMQLKFKSEYGSSKLEYPLFGEERAGQFDTLVLDARLNQAWHYGGTSSPISQRERAQYVRDQFAADLQSSLGGIGPAGNPVHLYLNGIYWGLYYLHERPDEHFAAGYLGGNADDYDVIKHNNEVVNGSYGNYQRLISAANRDLSQAANYQAVSQLLDIDAFIDYMQVNFYVGNEDWAHHNWYATFNRAEPGGLWRFHSWDAEHILKDVGYNATGKDDELGPTHIHQRLARNAEYRLRFADHVQRHFFDGGQLTPEAAAAFYQAELDKVSRAIVPESARWGDNQRSRPYTRDREWMAERDRLLGDYFPARTEIVLNQLRSRRLYPSLAPPQFSQHGGPVPQGFELTMDASDGVIVYTTDGSDPSQSETAIEYTAGLIVESNVTIKARSVANSQWSALVAATFELGVEGDFSGNGQLDASDIDLLLAAIREDDPGRQYDLNQDRQLNAADATTWVEEIANTRVGDANLDGAVDFADFVALSDNFGQADASWETGDFDGDGMVLFSDFVLLADHFGFVRRVG